ncbi:hypothetical protein BD408DRAFT_443636 [Parasitella parasitica]|nr:hypothetical protein BD408DRAFT_443636 [Parasitella parasitica]
MGKKRAIEETEVLLNQKLAKTLPLFYQQDIISIRGLDKCRHCYQAIVYRMKSFTQEFDKLFNDSHLDRIHSEYFDKLGKKDNRRIEKTIISALPITNKSDIEADSFIMKMALAKYKTNFLNMWSNNKAFYSLLNHLLLALLRVHLAPLREAKKRDYLDRQRDRQNARNVKQYASSIPVDDISLIRLSYHARKQLFNKERKQEESYLSLDK